jgi:APA family basic amino acid/polyamine antiporter
VSVIPAQGLAAAANPQNALTQGPLALVSEKSVMPGFGFWLTIIALFATFNTALAMTVASSRFIYGLSEQKFLPKVFSKIHPKTRAPYYAVFAAMALSLAFVFVGNLQMLGNLTTLGTFLMFFSIHVALIMLRLKEKRPQKVVPFNLGRIPLFAVVGAIFCAYMFLTQFWFPITVLGVTLPLMVFGFAVYSPAIPVYWYFRVRTRAVLPEARWPKK